MRLIELDLPADHESLATLLADRDWHPLGSGYYATVYGKTGANYVIKVFEGDSAYLAFLDLIAQHPNPHFPKIIGKLRIGDPHGRNIYRAVRMEKLSPMPRVEVGGESVSPAGMFAAYMLDRHASTLPHMKNRHRDLNSIQELNLELAREYLKDKPALIAALDLITDKLLPRFGLDLGDDVMERGDGTPVIIDPVAR